MPRVWPKQVVEVAGELVVADAVVDDPRLLELNGGALSYQSSSLVVKSGIWMLQMF
jgi:hypothetical protein